MAGVYISNIKIPQDKPVALLLCTDGSIGIFDVVAGELHARGNEEYEYRAIPVPDHGRLIDADAMENGLRLMAKYQEGNRQQGILGCCETIRLATTIIPADKKKNV